jgi:dihydrofolate synthase/folylpolyglutamate synthase
MTYEEVLDWMYRRIPMYQRTGAASYKIDLNKTRKIDAYFGHPHKYFRTIHVGGTNGKGSVSHLLASVLQSAGYKTGLYTSPHLKDFRERIQVNGAMAEKKYVIDFFREHKDYFEQVNPSFFEMTMAMALDYFKKKHVDVVVLEVGLGGRLDSTNIVDPEISVITNISFDHTQFLGNTLEAIAGEKAGIIKAQRPVVIGEYNPVTRKVFEKTARRLQAPIHFASLDFKLELKRGNAEWAVYRAKKGNETLYNELMTDLTGNYQSRNIVTVLKTAEVLNSLGYLINDENIKTGLAHVKENTSLKGRWHILERDPLIICDIAHNEAGLSLNLTAIKDLGFPHVCFVLGFVNDKNLDTILPLFPRSGKYFFTKAGIPRALDEKELKKKAERFGLIGKAFSTSDTALKEARKEAGPKDLIYVGGSTFLVSEVI